MVNSCILQDCCSLFSQKRISFNTAVLMNWQDMYQHSKKKIPTFDPKFESRFINPPLRHIPNLHTLPIPPISPSSDTKENPEPANSLPLVQVRAKGRGRTLPLPAESALQPQLLVLPATNDDDSNSNSNKSNKDCMFAPSARSAGKDDGNSIEKEAESYTTSCVLCPANSKVE